MAQNKDHADRREEFDRLVIAAFKEADSHLLEIGHRYGPEVLAAALANYIACILAGSPIDRRSDITEAIAEAIIRRTAKLSEEIDRVRPFVHDGSELAQ